MKHLLFLLPVLLLFFGCSNKETGYASGIRSAHDLFSAMENNHQWPSYRGFFAGGYMKGASLPDSFNIETGYNVKWNIGIPGMGLSCPSIWDQKIFITTAISTSDTAGFLPGIYGEGDPVNDESFHTWMLYCIDRTSGGILWEQVIHEGIPGVKRHPKSTHANTTVATDGKHVVVFLGGEGLHCYDINGTFLWKRDFGPIMAAEEVETTEWEFSSSPIIFDGRVIVQADALNTAFVEALDIETGKTLWRQDRDEVPGWSTPNIYFNGDQPLVAVNGYKRRAAYDLYTGEEVWWMNGGGDVPIPTPIPWKDLLYFNSAHGKHRPLMAVRSDATGEIRYPETETDPGKDFAWFYDRAGAYMNSVVVYDSLLYSFRWNGSLSCYEARTGKQIYNESVDHCSFIAAPVIADGRLWLVAEEGDVYQVAIGPEFKLLRKITLGEISEVAPGIMQDMIVFRTAGRLIGISE